LDSAFSPTSSSAFGWETWFHAYRFEAEPGLHEVRYRYLHPRLGRWCSRDRLEGEEGHNLYAFARNCTLNFSDPCGEVAIWIGVTVAFCIGVLVAFPILAIRHPRPIRRPGRPVRPYQPPIIRAPRPDDSTEFISPEGTSFEDSPHDLEDPYIKVWPVYGPAQNWPPFLDPCAPRGR
jgi:RHS repeat-associated protein